MVRGWIGFCTSGAISNTEGVMTACDWCLQEALVQTIDEKLWHFWKIISTEDQIMTSHENICNKCKSRYEGFSIYIERCKINASKVDEVLSMGQVKDEPSVDIEYPPLIKKEMSNEVDWNSYRPAVSSGVFIEAHMIYMIDILSAEEEPLVGIEEHPINEEEASDPDYPTASGGKEKDGLALRDLRTPSAT